MNHKKTFIVLLSGALVVAIGLGAIAYNSVFAASPSNISTSTSMQVEAILAKGPYDGVNREYLAEALGITEDELTAAYQEAYAAILDEAVAQDLITQAQADQLAENGRVFPFGGRWGGFLAENGLDFDTFLADALGISVDELKAAYQTAVFSRIDQAVTDGKLTEEQADMAKGRYALVNDSTFQSSMQSAFTDAVNQAVATGVITQAQADQILSKSGNLFSRGLFTPVGRIGPRGHGGGELMLGEALPELP
jgi:hypothetical protein